MNILVLGSKGQIGQALVSKLVSYGANYEVIELDIQISQDHDLRYKNKLIENYFRQADFVFFLAFDVGGSKYLGERQNQKNFIDNNLIIMFNVFSYLEKYSKKFIFISTQMSNMSFSTYGVLKRIGEFYTLNLSGFIVKLWNVFGNELEENKFHVISDFIKMGLETKQIKLKTDGHESRQFLHSSDCASALVLLMQKCLSNDFQNTIWDISSFQNTKIIELAKLIANLTNANVIPGIVKDVIQKDSNNEPSKEILKYWEPRLTLEQGIKIEITNFLEKKKISN